MELVGKKTRKTDEGEAPYLTFVTKYGFFGGPATWTVLKTYQKDQTKQYARWFCRVVTPMTGELGDLGDTYVADVLMRSGLTLVAVDGRVPTPDESHEVREWQRNVKLPELF